MYKAMTGIAVAVSLLAAASPASAQWRGHHGGWHRGGGYGVGAGLATGLIVGGALAAANRGYYDDGYYAQGGYAYAPGPGGNEEYCMQRYRSYDPGSGTYLGFDGRRHPC
jgi:hypothetical protein